MSKSVTRDSILGVFPLAFDPDMLALAESIADKLIGLYAETDLLKIYARIDELDDELLDILAYDFKVDWWDKDLTLAEKRQTLKDSWDVHRKLGTPGSVETAVSAIYETRVVEWDEYEGFPFHYKMDVNTAGELPDADVITAITQKNRYYANLRSILEAIEFRIRSFTPKLFAGVALRHETVITMHVSAGQPQSMEILTDEEGNILTDENYNILTT